MFRPLHVGYVRAVLASRLVGLSPASRSHTTLLLLEEVCLCIRVFSSGVRVDTGRVSVGPGGYVAAIKAAQLGLRVSTLHSRRASS